MADRTATGTGTDAYVRAERTYWARYGLEPVTRWAQAGRPTARLRVQDVGTGTPTLFVHGTGGSGTYFAPLIATLDGVRALIVDRPGWGLSDPTDYAARSYRDVIADTLRSVLDTLGIERANVVGASIGDLWAIRFAQAAPDRVEHVVLLGGGPISQEITVPPFIKLLRSPLGRVIVALPEKPGMFRKQLGQMGHGASLGSSEDIGAFVEWHGALTRETRWGHHERDMVRAIVQRGGFVDGLVPTSDEISAIATPTLVVGDSDPVGSEDIWRRFVTSLPSAELEVVRPGGHLVWLDDPQGVGRRVSTFLAS